MRCVELLEILGRVQFPFPAVTLFKPHEVQINGVANKAFGAGQHLGRVQAHEVVVRTDVKYVVFDGPAETRIRAGSRA